MLQKSARMTRLIHACHSCSPRTWSMRGADMGFHLMNLHNKSDAHTSTGHEASGERGLDDG
jgi:hypothetical protein